MVWYSAIPLGNWRKPINLNLHGTLHGELRVPFAQHVSLSDAPSSNASFPQFTLLPLELQLRVIYCCDQSTLFQLMHTSSFMRAEARKLFFSDPEAFYSIDAEWLLEGAYPGYTVHDLNFMMCVEHLVIEFAWMKEDTWMDLAEQRSWNYVDKVLTTGMLGNIRKFWSMVQLRFPRLKRVMISDDYDRSGLYWKVGEMGPTDIKVFVALRQGGDEYPCGRSERRLWQRIVTSQADTHTDTKLQWEKRLPWCEPLIIMPYRGLHGLVGKFQDFYIRQEHWHRQGRGMPFTSS